MQITDISDSLYNNYIKLMSVTHQLQKFLIVIYILLFFQVRDCLLNVWLRKSNFFREKGLTHWCVMLDCFDLPATPTSLAYIYYKHTSVQPVQRGHWESTTHLNQRTISVESPRHIVFPSLLKPVKRRTNYPFSITVCRGPVFGTPPLIAEWIRYQKTIGVDHIYLVVEKSFVYSNGLDTPEIAKALQDGYLSYTVWENPTDDVRSYYHSQLLAMEDCLYRLIGLSDYVLPVDTDDFFTPVSTQKLLHYYVDRFCHKNSTCGALNMRWVQRHLECGLKERVPLDGNVTSVLASETMHTLDVNNKVNYKTVHRTSFVTDIQVHKHGNILPGFDHVSLPMTEAYVSHVREHRVEEGTRCAHSHAERNKSVHCVC